MAAVQAVAVPVHCDVPLLVLRDAQDGMRVPGRCRAKAPHRPCGPCAMHAPLSLKAMSTVDFIVSISHLQKSAIMVCCIQLPKRHEPAAEHERARSFRADSMSLLNGFVMYWLQVMHSD